MSETKKKKDKILLIFTGAIIGLVIGGAIVKFQSDYFSKQKDFGSFISGLTDFFSKKAERTVPLRFQTNYDILILKWKKNTNTLKNPANFQTPDTINYKITTELIETASFDGHDSIINYSIDNQLTNKDMVVKKDELLYTKTILIENKTNTSSPSDSLINNFTSTSSSIQVEFWISPVNYKGYKMSRNKLVLFGLTPTDNISIKELDKNYYLKYMNLYYKLSFTDNFANFQMVVNPDILNKLK